MKIGKTQTLEIKRFTTVGAYLTDGSEEVLLPKKQLPENSKVGDKIAVFIYKDSSDRIITTTNKPLAEVGEVALLTVVEKSKIGSFLNIGLERDVLLPFSETIGTVHELDKVVVAIYVDKSERLCATMKIKDYLLKNPPYKENDWIDGIIYQTNKELGLFILVDGKYDGLVPAHEVLGIYKRGESLRLRVSNVKPDGKLELSFKQRSHERTKDDVIIIKNRLKSAGGRMNIGDKSHPSIIFENFQMSKQQFKKALGSLYKSGDIIIGENFIELNPERKEDSRRTSEYKKQGEFKKNYDTRKNNPRKNN